MPARGEMRRDALAVRGMQEEVQLERRVTDGGRSIDAEHRCPTFVDISDGAVTAAHDRQGIRAGPKGDGEALFGAPECQLAVATLGHCRAQCQHRDFREEEKQLEQQHVFAGDDVSKGGWEWIVAHNANSASTRSVAAEPPGPNRTAAQSRNGNGAYKNTTGVLAAGNRWVKTRTQVRSRPAVRIAASRRHFREVCHHTNGSTVAAWRITGTSVIVASAFEYKRMRHRLQ